MHAEISAHNCKSAVNLNQLVANTSTAWILIRGKRLDLNDPGPAAAQRLKSANALLNAKQHTHSYFSNDTVLR